MPHGLHHRLATRENIPALTALMQAAIAELQKPFLNSSQIASSRAIMGLDTQLIVCRAEQHQATGRRKLRPLRRPLAEALANRTSREDKAWRPL